MGRPRIEKQDAIKKASGRHGGKVYGEEKGKGKDTRYYGLNSCP